MLKQTRELRKPSFAGRTFVGIDHFRVLVLDVHAVEHVFAVVFVEEMGPLMALGGSLIEVNVVEIRAFSGFEVDDLDVVSRLPYEFHREESVPYHRRS
jgi:hypothetical protein